jgi:multidrug efflux system outer membrane protein
MKKNFSILLLVILAGCANSKYLNGEEVLKPIDISIPEQWETISEIEIPNKEIWWVEFNDKNLMSFIENFQKNNLDLKSSLISVQNAHLASKITSASLLPSFALQSSGNQSEQNTAGFPPFFQDLFGSQNNGQLTSFEQENYNLSLTAQWEIDLWGKVFNQSLASKMDYLSAKYSQNYYELSLTAEAIKLFYGTVELQKSLDWAEEKLKNLTTLYELSYQRYQQGSISEKQLKQIEILLSQTNTEYENIRAGYNSLIRSTKILQSMFPLIENERIKKDFPGSLPPIPSYVPSEIIQRRPDLLSARFALLSSLQKKKVATKQLLPSFNLIGSNGTASNDLKDLLDEDFKVWSGSISFFTPIFNSGKLINNRKLAKNNAEIAMYNYMSKVLGAYAEVETALEMDRIAQIALNESIKILEATEKIYSITLKEYGQGIVGFEEIITQENRLSDVKIYLAQSEKMRIEKRINLILALGGGFRFETKR